MLIPVPIEFGALGGLIALQLGVMLAGLVGLYVGTRLVVFGLAFFSNMLSDGGFRFSVNTTTRRR